VPDVRRDGEDEINLKATPMHWTLVSMLRDCLRGIGYSDERASEAALWLFALAALGAVYLAIQIST
jgi:hypothetical protein